MQDQKALWARNPDEVSIWVDGWVKAAAEGQWSLGYSARMIGEAAEKLKNRFCTDGLWAPGAERAYSILAEGVSRAKAEDEKRLERYKNRVPMRPLRPAGPGC